MARGTDDNGSGRTADAGGRSGRKHGRRPVRKLSLIVLIIMMLVAGGFLIMITIVDAFPDSMLRVLIGVLLGTLIVSGVLMFTKWKWVRGVGIFLALFFVALYGMGIYYMSTTYATFARMTNEDEVVQNDGDFDPTKDSFNLYITGIDQWNEEKGYDLERSDVNMILTVCPQTRKILLTSIPRDAYVALHRTGTMDKLTHTGIYGVDETLSTVSDWMGIDFRYYVKANFNACVDLVDAIGGVDIYNPVEFRSALNNHKYEQGWIHVMGRGALYFARERKAFEGEDQNRVKNQLIVVKAILNKVMTSSTLITSYGEIMNVLGDEIETNIPSSDMQALVKMQLSDLSEWDIETQRMSGEYDMEVVASLDPSNEYLVLKVSDESFRSCVDGIRETMNPTEEEITEYLEQKKLENQQKSVTDFVRGLLGKRSGADNEEDSGKTETEEEKK